jgi:hypothetical protein
MKITQVRSASISVHQFHKGEAGIKRAKGNLREQLGFAGKLELNVPKAICENNLDSRVSWN